MVCVEFYLFIASKSGRDESLDDILLVGATIKGGFCFVSGMFYQLLVQPLKGSMRIVFDDLFDIGRELVHC